MLNKIFIPKSNLKGLNTYSKMVSREKYDKLKEKASQWRDKTTEYKLKYENMLTENEKLMELNDDLNDKLNDKTELIPNNREEEMKQEIKSLNKQARLDRDKYNKDYFDIERQLFRKEGEVDRLNAALEDYKERYKEFKDEARQMRRDRLATN